MNIRSTASVMLALIAMSNCDGVIAGIKQFSIYTPPVDMSRWGEFSVTNIDCRVQNLDSSLQYVIVELMNPAGTSIAMRADMIAPGEVKTLAQWLDADNPVSYCQFKVKSKKVRGFLTTYDKNFRLLDQYEAQEANK
jgi:hypothetical protein